MEKSKTIFDFLNDITYHKIPWENQLESDRKRFQPYMLNRWLSMHPDYLDIVAEVQPVISRLNSREFYVFFTDILPKKKFYAKYVKSSIDSENNIRLLSLISDKLRIGSRDAEEIFDSISSEDLKEWLMEYGYSDKEIKKRILL